MKWGVVRKDPSGSKVKASTKEKSKAQSPKSESSSTGSTPKTKVDTSTKVLKSTPKPKVETQTKDPKVDDKLAALKERAAPERAKIYKQYETEGRAKGLSEADAARVARNKVIRNRVLIGAAVLAAAGAGAYLANDLYQKDFKGINLEAGATLKNVNVFGKDLNMNRRLYTTINDKDSNKYVGLYTKQLLSQEGNTKVYQATLKANEAIRAPSNREAVKMYKEFRKEQLAKNPNVELLLPANYRDFNRTLVSFGNNGSKRSPDAVWYDTLKKKGFNALLDTNDQHNSGYNTRYPLIVLDAGKSTKMEDVRRLQKSDMDSRAKSANRNVYGHALMTTAPNTIAIASGIGLISYAKRRSAMQSTVLQYREDHPGTKLSDEDIYYMMLTEDKK